ncbi:MAG: NUDIX hydrolase [Fusobacteriaceae bacterium]
MLDLNKINMNLSEKIIGKHKYFNSSVILLIVEDGSNELSILFQKRAKNIRQGGEISFPGGKVDSDDENSLDTALRETYEEIGVERDKIKILGKIGTLVMPSGTLVDAYCGNIKIKNIEDLKINKDEVEECFLVPVSFFFNNKPRVEKLQVETLPHFEENGEQYIFPYKELNLPERYHSKIKGISREVYFYLYEDKVIWGITADIIYEFVSSIKKGDIYVDK